MSGHRFSTVKNLSNWLCSNMKNCRGQNACSLWTSLGRLHCFIRPGALRFSAAGNHGHYDGAREEEHAVSDFSINHKVSHLSFISLFASIVWEGFNKQINNFGVIFHRSWTPHPSPYIYANLDALDVPRRLGFWRRRNGKFWCFRALIWSYSEIFSSISPVLTEFYRIV